MRLVVRASRTALSLVLFSLVVLGITGCWEEGAKYDEAMGAIENSRYPYPPLWAPDGQHIVFNRDTRMYAVAVDKSFSYSFPHGGDLSIEQAGSISPSNEIARWRFEFERTGFEIETIALDGSDRRVTTKDYNKPAFYPAWSPDGLRLAFVVWRGNSDALVIVNGDGSNLNSHAVPTHLMMTGSPPEWSPDGRSVAVLVWELTCAQSQNTSDCPVAIYVVDISTSQMSHVSETVSRPAWAPDGSRMAFIHYEDGVERIVTIRPDGSEMQTVATIPEDLAVFSTSEFRPKQHRVTNWYATKGRWVSWSRDGLEIRVQQSPFITVNADGADMRVMHAPWEALAAWSPDESRIAVYLPLEARLVTMDRDGSDKRVLFGATALEWELPELEWTVPELSR